MKYIKTLILAALLIPSITFGAISAGWTATSTDKGQIKPTAINGNVPYINVPGFISTASSTIPSSFFNLMGLSNGCLNISANIIGSTGLSCGGSGTFPFTSVAGYNSTSTALGLLGGLFTGTASTTFGGNTYFTSGFGQGFGYIGSNGLFQTVSTTTLLSYATTTTDIWVDSNRTDSYTANGTILFPYKTIGAAIKSFPANYHLATGSYIESALTFTATSTIDGNQAAIFSFSGTPFASAPANITFSTGAILNDVNILTGTVYMTDPAVSDPGTFQNSLVNGNIFLYGLAIFNGGQIQGGTLYTGAGSLTNFAGVNILSPIFTDGTINLNDVNVATSSPGKYIINATTTGATIDINGASISNTASGGGGILCTSSLVTAPNNINALSLNLGTTTDAGSINCGASPALIGSYSAFDPSGNRLYAISTNLTSYSFDGLNVETNTILAQNSGTVSVSTTTSVYPLTSFSATLPQISLSPGAGFGQWTMRSAGNNFYLSTTTVAGTATTSISALEIDGNTGTTTLRGLKISAYATSTSNVGMNLTGGCYAINGGCVGGSGGGTTPSIGGTLTSGTLGSVLFSGSAVFAQDNANFFWDSTNHFLGLATTTPNSTLSDAGSLSVAYKAVSGTYTATGVDYLINATSSTFTIALPTAVGIVGRTYVIKNSGTGVVTVDPNGSQTLDGSLTYPLTIQYDFIRCTSNGSNWILN